MSFFKQLFATPKNPYIPGWDQIDPMVVEFSGCKLRLDLPPRSDPDFKDEIYNHFDIYNDFYEDTSYLPWYSQDNILRKTIADRAMVIKNKPWHEKNLSALDVNVQICKVTDLPDSMTCLKPHHFLQVIDKYQFFTHGPNRKGNVSNSFYSTFNNWEVIKIGELDWIFYEVKKNRKVQDNVIPSGSYLLTPLDENIFIKISIGISNPYDPIEECLCAYNKIISTLISRISLSVSPHLFTKREEILQRSNQQYPNARLPLKWDDFYIENWHENISKKHGENLLIYPIPKYDPNK